VVVCDWRHSSQNLLLSMNLCRGGKLEDVFVQNVLETALNVNVVVLYLFLLQTTLCDFPPFI